CAGRYIGYLTVYFDYW
nr:immunoglobulin heavy chain junction region [Macaca mulatta]